MPLEADKKTAVVHKYLQNDLSLQHCPAWNTDRTLQRGLELTFNIQIGHITNCYYSVFIVQISQTDHVKTLEQTSCFFIIKVQVHFYHQSICLSSDIISKDAEYIPFKPRTIITLGPVIVDTTSAQRLYLYTLSIALCSFRIYLKTDQLITLLDFQFTVLVLSKLKK